MQEMSSRCTPCLLPVCWPCFVLEPWKGFSWHAHLALMLPAICSKLHQLMTDLHKQQKGEAGLGAPHGQGIAKQGRAGQGWRAREEAVYVSHWSQKKRLQLGSTVTAQPVYLSARSSCLAAFRVKQRDLREMCPCGLACLPLNSNPNAGASLPLPEGLQRGSTGRARRRSTQRRCSSGCRRRWGCLPTTRCARAGNTSREGLLKCVAAPSLPAWFVCGCVLPPTFTLPVEPVWVDLPPAQS